MNEEEKKEYEKQIEREIEDGINERLEHRFGGGCSGDGWWEDRSLPAKIALGILFGILGIAFMFLLILVTRLLWNWLMPEIFGLPKLTYWKTAGLMVLSWILFKGVNFGGDNSSGRQRRRKRELRSAISRSDTADYQDSANNPETNTIK